MTDQHIQFIKSIAICNAFALTFGICFILIINYVNRKENKIKLPISNGLILLTLLYFITVTAITVVPLPFAYNVKKPPKFLNLVPIINTVKNLLDTSRGRDRYLASDTLQNIIGNILMFIPLGILLPLITKQLAAAKPVLIIAIVCSLGIELTQFFMRYVGVYRQVDIDDVILNTLGAVAGFFVFKKWTQQRKKTT